VVCGPGSGLGCDGSDGSAGLVLVFQREKTLGVPRVLGVWAVGAVTQPAPKTRARSCSRAFGTQRTGPGGKESAGSGWHTARTPRIFSVSQAHGARECLRPSHLSELLMDRFEGARQEDIKSSLPRAARTDSSAAAPG